ncbi:unnamed protein product [Microthlaspi erraticum]|uniref:Uncharacterized protein n=1 Tax=Microthlaspi erraticum TaxID=1685480 RepID=A0A6D2KCW9_9BRAS|nr:unnamed protein product [Microthlaspi erraticum]
MKCDNLLIKNLERSFLRNSSSGFQMTKLLLLLLHEIIGSVEGSSTSCVSGLVLGALGNALNVLMIHCLLVPLCSKWILSILHSTHMKSSGFCPNAKLLLNFLKNHILELYVSSFSCDDTSPMQDVRSNFDFMKDDTGECRLFIESVIMVGYDCNSLHI